MRGTVSAGMAFALDELGLVTAFDAVYGASAGAITAAWLLSRPDGLRGWTEPAYARAFIRRSGLMRGRPVADVRALIEELYQTTFPMDFAAVLASPIEFHPLATDAATGQSTDLRPLVGTPAELRLALRASAALPLLAGPPVEFGGRRYYDAGLSESVPYRTALAQGATHVLVLRSRRDPVIWPDGRAPSRSVRLITRTTLRRESPALRAVFLSRDARLAADDVRLADYQALPPAPQGAVTPTSPTPGTPTSPTPGTPTSPTPGTPTSPAPGTPTSPTPGTPTSPTPGTPTSPTPGTPTSPTPGSAQPDSAPPISPSPAPDSTAATSASAAVFSIRPPADSPVVSRLATDGRLLRAAFESGRTATHAALVEARHFRGQ